MTTKPRAHADPATRFPRIGPGGVVGVIGGGQLGRMLAIAARRMGYRVHVVDPTTDCPTAHVADAQVTADYGDVAALRHFAQGVDVITFEFENVPAEALDAIAEVRPIHPSPDVLRTCRHRVREKLFLQSHGIPVAPFHPCSRAEDVKAGLDKLGVPAILKTAEFGYDGKGQVRIGDPGPRNKWAQAWNELGVGDGACGENVAVLEGFVEFTKELSVVCARTADGEVRCFDPAENQHAHGILDVSTVPAGISDAIAEEARRLATRIAQALGCVGVLAVEMFLVQKDGRDALIVNELAPRPHNSGHHTFDACVTSQFEQQLRAVCGMPLGDPSLLRPAVAMANLLGDLWFPPEGPSSPEISPEVPTEVSPGSGVEPDWSKVLAMGDVKLHLYGKHEARRGRKMGHLVAMADTPEAARGRVLEARAALTQR